MRLNLSSAAAPEATLAELIEACRTRGIEGLELVAPASMAEPLAEVWPDGRLRGTDVFLCGLYLTSAPLSDARKLARFSSRTGVPVVTPIGTVDPEEIEELAGSFSRAGGELLVSMPTEPAAFDLFARRATSTEMEGVGFAWELRPGEDDPILMSQVLTAAGSRLRYIRLHGGGPEAVRQGGAGIGPLMARLAAARFSGSVVLLPSNRRFHYAWRAWLGRVGGWGCGSKQSDPIPLRPGTLPVSTTG